tara:strand:+ start:856 stop:1731 length:876 start_codon:yes stop_codon:yes gene_type:complete
MGIIASIGNIYFVYQFLKKLVTPFEKTKAFEMGIIDKDGKILKRRRDLETKEEKAAYTLSDTLIWNLKKILGKIPLGKSKLASYAAALWLIKEQDNGKIFVNEKELEAQFFDYFEKLENDELTESTYDNVSDKMVIGILQAYDEEQESHSKFLTLANMYTGLSKKYIQEEFLTMTLPFNETINEEFEQFLNEDAPVTAVAGVATKGIPLGTPPKGLVMKKFAGMDVFSVNPSMYPKSRHGKKRYDRYSRYVGEDEAGNYIRAYARKYPKKPIIVMDSDTGCMQFLRHGFGK